MAAAAATSLATAAEFGGGPGGPEGQADQRPNIVIIETDDQTVEQMRFLVKTQRLLADQGVTFDNSFVSLSLCCPSRATLLTGQYAHNHHVASNAGPNGGFHKLDSSRTLAVWLKRAGYTTDFVGKYLNGYGKQHERLIPQGWMNFHGLLDFQYFNYKVNDNGVLHGYGHRPQDYQTDVFTRKAVRIIRKSEFASHPFFLWLSYFAPHAGGPPLPGDPPGYGVPHPAPRYEHAFESIKLPRPASFNEVDVSGKPPAIQKRPLLTKPEIAAIRVAYQKQVETLLSVDDGVARIVNALKRAGKLDNTVIFFTCDNGIFHGEHRVPSGKVLLYEPSIRVPLLARGPGIPQGVHMDQLVANIDLAPTILDLAHAQPSKHFVLDGRSLVPLFTHPWKEGGRDLLIERLPGTGEETHDSKIPTWTYGETGNGDNGNQGKAGTPPDRAYAAVRTPRFIYADYANGFKELYDLWHDPQELHNVAGQPVYAGIQQELARRLAVLRHCRGKVCRAGPRIGLSVAAVGRASSGGCARSRIRASVGGPDARWVYSVRYFVDGHQRALARAASLTTFLGRVPARASGKAAPRIRARILFVDGRKVDRVHPLPAICR